MYRDDAFQTSVQLVDVLEDVFERLLCHVSGRRGGERRGTNHGDFAY